MQFIATGICFNLIFSFINNWQLKLAKRKQESYDQENTNTDKANRIDYLNN